MRRQAIRSEKGQTLILVVFALPLLLALIALVSDGSNLFANKRSVQNVADASVLAAVRELNPCFGTGSVAACSSQVQAVASDYSSRNGGPSPNSLSNRRIHATLRGRLLTWEQMTFSRLKMI